jgi:hypothetical protein
MPMLLDSLLITGVSHSDDATFVFQVASSNTEETQQDKDMSKLLVDIWDSYNRNGYECTYMTSLIMLHVALLHFQ